MSWARVLPFAFLRVPDAVPGADCTLCAAGAGLSHHRPVLLDVEIDHRPPVAMLVHGIAQAGSDGCDSVSAVGAPWTAGMQPSLPAW